MYLIFALVDYLIRNIVVESDFLEPLNPITFQPSSRKLSSYIHKPISTLKRQSHLHLYSAQLKSPSISTNNQPTKTKSGMEIINGTFSNKNSKANFGKILNVGVQKKNVGLEKETPYIWLKETTKWKVGSFLYVLVISQEFEDGSQWKEEEFNRA